MAMLRRRGLAISEDAGAADILSVYGEASPCGRRASPHKLIAMSRTLRTLVSLLALVTIGAVLPPGAAPVSADEQAPRTGSPQRVALIGASGRVGSRVLAELVSRGHTVTGIARTPANISTGPNVTAVAGDVTEPEALAAVLTGHDAVISAVPFAVTDPDALIGAVRASGVKRYIVVGGAASLLNADGVMLADTPELSMLKTMAEPAGGIAFLAALRDVTDLDWTFFSPAVNFAPGQRTGVFRLGGDQVILDASGESRISMEDYAIALVDELENPRHVRQRFTAGY